MDHKVMIQKISNVLTMIKLVKGQSNIIYILYSSHEKCNDSKKEYLYFLKCTEPHF